jgi:hypothetical protein
MYPTGDEFRQALPLCEPSPEFTARVMERVRGERRVRKFPLRRWSIVGAIAASLMAGIYVRHQAAERRASLLSAQQAEEELLHSLQLAGWQIHKAREAVLSVGMEEPQ